MTIELGESAGWLLFLIFAFLMIGVGINILVKNRSLKTTCTEIIPGKITSIETQRSVKEDGSDIYHFPVVEYTVESINYRQRSTTGYTRCRHKVGDAVTVYYNALNPGKYYIKEDAAHHLFCGAAFIAFGVAILIIAMLAYSGECEANEGVLIPTSTSGRDRTRQSQSIGAWKNAPGCGFSHMPISSCIRISDKRHFHSTKCRTTDTDPYSGGVRTFGWRR